MGKRRKNELPAGQQKSRVIGTRRGSAHRGRKQDGDRRQEQHPGSGEQQEAPPEPASGAGEARTTPSGGLPARGRGRIRAGRQGLNRGTRRRSQTGSAGSGAGGGCSLPPPHGRPRPAHPAAAMDAGAGQREGCSGRTGRLPGRAGCSRGSAPGTGRSSTADRAGKTRWEGGVQFIQDTSGPDFGKDGYNEKSTVYNRAFSLAVVARLGFEPRQTESESVVLPLHNRASLTDSFIIIATYS